MCKSHKFIKGKDYFQQETPLYFLFLCFPLPLSEQSLPCTLVHLPLGFRTQVKFLLTELLHEHLQLG
jgi:hypothetical protein